MAIQASAKSILLGSISHSYQDNILVLGEVKLVTTFVKTSSLTCSLSSLFVQARKMMNVWKNVIWCKDGAQCVLLSVLVALTLLCSFLARLPRCAAVAASKCKQRRDSLLLHSVHTLYHFHFEPFTWLLARHNLPSLVFLVWFFSNSELSRPLQIEMRQPSSPITPIARHLWGWLYDQLCFLSLFWLFSSRPTQPNWTCTGEVYLQKESHRSTTG